MSFLPRDAALVYMHSQYIYIYTYTCYIYIYTYYIYILSYRAFDCEGSGGGGGQGADENPVAPVIWSSVWEFSNIRGPNTDPKTLGLFL